MCMHGKFDDLGRFADPSLLILTSLSDGPKHGYAIWLAYGLSTGSLPLVVVDTVGLLCAALTLAIALSLRGSPIRPATRNSRNMTSISPRPAAPDLQP